MEVDKLIIEYLDFRKSKKEAIHFQKYEKAASYRDKERDLSVQIFNILKNFDKFNSYNDCDKIIDEYCLEKYNTSIYDTNCLKSIIRVSKLNSLGI